MKTWWERNTFNTHLNCFMWQRVLICVCVDVSPVVKATRRKSNKADDEKKEKRWDDTIVLSSSQSSLLVLSAHHALHLSHTLAPLLPPSTVYHSYTHSHILHFLPAHHNRASICYLLYLLADPGGCTAHKHAQMCTHDFRGHLRVLPETYTNVTANLTFSSADNMSVP